MPRIEIWGPKTRGWNPNEDRCLKRMTVGRWRWKVHLLRLHVRYGSTHSYCCFGQMRGISLTFTRGSLQGYTVGPARLPTGARESISSGLRTDHIGGERAMNTTRITSHFHLHLHFVRLFNLTEVTGVFVYARLGALHLPEEFELCTGKKILSSCSGRKNTWNCASPVDSFQFEGHTNSGQGSRPIPATTFSNLPPYGSNFGKNSLLMKSSLHWYCLRPGCLQPSQLCMLCSAKGEHGHTINDSGIFPFTASPTKPWPPGIPSHILTAANPSQ